MATAQALIQSSHNRVDVPRTREQTRVTGDPADCKSIIIVHLPTEDPFAPRTNLGRSKDILQRLSSRHWKLSQVDKSCRTESQRLINPFVTEGVQIRTADLFNNLAQDHKS